MREKYNELLSKAQTAFASGEYENTLAYARTAFTMEPGALGAYTIAGNACFLLERFVDAEKYFRKALELNPKDGECSALLGNTLFAQERFKEAIVCYANAEKLGCSETTLQKVYYVMGLINQVEGKFKDALVNYDKSDRFSHADADQMDILLNRIEIYKNLGELEKAEDAARQLKLLIPSEFSSYQLLFQLQLEQRKFPQAIATLKEAETFCPQSIDNRIEIRFDYAMIYCFQADVWPDQSTHYYDMALEVLTELSKETALPLDVKCEIEVTQAEIFMKTNREQQAVVIAERVAHMDEEDLIEYVERCRFMLLQYYSGKKDYSKVQEYAVLLKDSETVFHRHMGYYAEANALSQLASKDTSLQKKAQRAYEVAIAYYKNCTVSSPGDYLAYLYRAMAYVDIGKYDRAQEILRVLPEDGRKKLQAHIDRKRNGGSCS